MKKEIASILVYFGGLLSIFLVTFYCFSSFFAATFFTFTVGLAGIHLLHLALVHGKWLKPWWALGEDDSDPHIDIEAYGDTFFDSFNIKEVIITLFILALVLGPFLVIRPIRATFIKFYGELHNPDFWSLFSHKNPEKEKFWYSKACYYYQLAYKTDPETFNYNTKSYMKELCNKANRIYPGEPEPRIDWKIDKNWIDKSN